MTQFFDVPIFLVNIRVLMSPFSHFVVTAIDVTYSETRLEQTWL